MEANDNNQNHYNNKLQEPIVSDEDLGESVNSTSRSTRMHNSRSCASNLSAASARALDDNDSGYTSDLSPDGTSEPDTDTSDFQNIYEASDGDESVSSKISFIQKKQELLGKFAAVLGEEERYNAATAMETARKTARLCSGTSSNNHSGASAEEDTEALWNEAKDVLRIISQKAGELRMNECPRSLLMASCRGGGGVVRANKRPANPKDPNISLSSVQKLSSARYETGKGKIEDDSDGSGVAVRSIPETVFREGQWMAKALIWSEPSPKPAGGPVGLDNPVKVSSRPQDCRWRVVSDPLTCSLGLVPPTCMSLTNAVDLQEAIAVTDKPRLVTQSTPPFCVVHVNRAFLLLAELGAREQIIGRPVESMVYVTQSLTGPRLIESYNDDDDSYYIDGVISVHSKITACRLRVFPVLDRSRRRRIESGRYGGNNRAHCMSHVLVQMKPSTKLMPMFGAAVPIPKPFSQTRQGHGNTDNKSKPQTGASPGMNNGVLGTVG